MYSSVVYRLPRNVLQPTKGESVLHAIIIGCFLEVPTFLTMISLVPYIYPRVLSDEDVKRIFTDSETEVHTFTLLDRDTKSKRHLAIFKDTPSLVSFLTSQKVLLYMMDPMLIIAT